MPQHRKARLPSVVPDALIAVEEANIRAAVAGWYGRRLGVFTTESSHQFVARYFLRCLQTNDETLDCSLLVELADNGHPPADQALRDYIDAAMNADRFQELPMAIRDYARRSLRSAELTNYPPRSGELIDNYLRDAGLTLLMKKVKAKWPGVPLLNSGKRASAAALCAVPFGLSERQARRIYQHRRGRGRGYRFAMFMLSRPFDVESNGSGLKESGHR